MTEMVNASEKGEAVISLLKVPRNLDGSVYQSAGNSVTVTNEEGLKAQWDSYVVFPKELSKAFPGSYIDPDLFLRQLGAPKKERGIFLPAILGSTIGSYENPVFGYENVNDGFDLRVIGGATNGEALKMSHLATQSFKDPYVRAAYQDAMFNAIAPALSSPPVKGYGVRIHDDCLASGDSIAGYLTRRLQDDPGTLKKGVEVVIDGPATAQGVLFLKAFAQAHDIPLHITAGYMAFGLSSGIVENDVRKHANYITYPEELLKYFDPSVQEELKKLRAQDGNIYVVGDMGEAEQGIGGSIMQQIRQETGRADFCPWNDLRCDPHGDHPNGNGKLKVPDIINGRPQDVYFARGGYLPYAFDQMLYPHFARTNKIIERASRQWTQEYGYGAGFKSV